MGAKIEADEVFGFVVPAHDFFLYFLKKSKF
jgi:hypothetical protein